MFKVRRVEAKQTKSQKQIQPTNPDLSGFKNQRPAGNNGTEYLIASDGTLEVIREVALTDALNEGNALRQLSHGEKLEARIPENQAVAVAQLNEMTSKWHTGH